MFRWPKIGERVIVRFAKRKRPYMKPIHNKAGTVRIVSKGPGPRNHGVVIDGRLYSIPCGNLFPADTVFRGERHDISRGSQATGSMGYGWFAELDFDVSEAVVLMAILREVRDALDRMRLDEWGSRE